MVSRWARILKFRGKGQRSRDTGTFLPGTKITSSPRQMVVLRPNLNTMDSRSACIHDVLKVKVKVKGHVIRFCAVPYIAFSRRQMARLRPNLHTMVYRLASIHGALKVKVNVKAYVIRALLCWTGNSVFIEIYVIFLFNTFCSLMYAYLYLVLAVCCTDISRPVLATAAGTFFTRWPRCPGSHGGHLWVFGCLREVAYHPEHQLATRQQWVFGATIQNWSVYSLNLCMNLRPCWKLHFAVNWLNANETDRSNITICCRARIF